MALWIEKDDLDKAQFWQLIEDAHAKSGGECEAQAVALKSSLSLIPVEELIAFERIFNECRQAAYRWDLWGAAYLINGGGSDDGFEYFRRWLIGQGQTIFEAALADPDGLADLTKTDIEWGDAWLECEELGYVAGEVYEEKAGREMPSDGAGFIPGEPAGMKWEEDDLDALYPKIAARINR